MNKNTLSIIIIVLIIVIGGYFYFTNQTSNGIYEGDTTNDGAKVDVVYKNETTNEGVTTTPKTLTVTYTDQGFNPKSIEISLGDTVTFLNQSSGGMWVGSARHPDHVVYDGTTLDEHCATGATPSFDSCSATPKGSSWSFTFKKTGTWGYHNHVKSSDFGSVVVK